MYLSAAGSIGRREINQDSLLADRFLCQRGAPGAFQFQSPQLPAGPLAMALCDGACEQGDLASATAVDLLYQELEQLHTAKRVEDLHPVVDTLNQRVCDLFGPERNWDGLAISTLSLLCLGAGRYILCTIGDSPVYRLRGKELSQLSQVQTLAALHNGQNQPAALEAERHVLTNYLGRHQGGGSASAVWTEDVVLPGDLFLLCSDGILERLPEKKLRTALLRHGSEAAPELVRLAFRSGSTDNLTALVVRADG